MLLLLGIVFHHVHHMLLREENVPIYPSRETLKVFGKKKMFGFIFIVETIEGHEEEDNLPCESGKVRRRQSTL